MSWLIKNHTHTHKHTQKHTHTHTKHTRAHTHPCMHTCTRTHTRAQAHTCAHTHTYKYIWIWNVNILHAATCEDHVSGTSYCHNRGHYYRLQLCKIHVPHSGLFLAASWKCNISICSLFIYINRITIVPITAHKCYTAHMTTNQWHWVPIQASKPITTQLNISISCASGCVQTN